MFVGIKYFNEAGNFYGGRQYSYMTNLQLKVGDAVLAPTSNAPEGSRAIVTAVDLPEPTFQCKEITSYYVSED